MNNQTIIQQLQTIAGEEAVTIREKVARQALDYTAEDSTAFFRDVLTHGCISGMISPLVYYRDTHNFFDVHYDEIEELRREYEESVGEPIRIKGDMKNFYAWFAFEETARKLAHELGISV